MESILLSTRFIKSNGYQFPFIVSQNESFTEFDLERVKLSIICCSIVLEMIKYLIVPAPCMPYYFLLRQDNSLNLSAKCRSGAPTGRSTKCIVDLDNLLVVLRGGVIDGPSAVDFLVVAPGTLDLQHQDWRDP